MSLFEPAIKKVWEFEGGYVNDPLDSGGETKYGISKARYPNIDIFNLTRADAKQLYYNDFWKRFRVGEVNAQPSANMMLDMVILHNGGIIIIQRGLNASGKNVAVDNVIGPQTINAINSVDTVRFINNTVKKRIEYMESLVALNPKNQRFIKGWRRRANFFLYRGQSGVMILLILGGVAYWWSQRNKNRKSLKSQKNQSL